jgi:hypothetical protein
MEWSRLVPSPRWYASLGMIQSVVGIAQIISQVVFVQHAQYVIMALKGFCADSA